jgi:opacity protein-like surface antigen
MKLLLLLISLAISPLFATMGGFYVGGHGGVAFIKGEHKYINGDNGSVGALEVNKMGYLLGINVGYLSALNGGKMYIGGEVYASILKASLRKQLQTKTGPIEGNVSIQPKHIYGAAALIGTMLNPRVLVYGRLGYEMQSYAFNYTELTFQSPDSQKVQKTVSGFAPGAGGLYRLSNSLAVGGDIIVPILPKIEARKSTQTINGAKRGFEYSPTQYRVMAKVIYSF